MNIKNKSKRNENVKKALLGLFRNKSIFAVVLLCIAIVGLGTVLVITYNISSSLDYESQNVVPEVNHQAVNFAQAKTSSVAESNMPNENVAASNMKGIVQEEKKEITVTVAPEQIQQERSKVKKVTEPKGLSNIDKKEVIIKNIAIEPKEHSYIMPVSGQISFDYSMDKPVFSKTLDEWRTHRGVDIEADKGTNVKAALDGVITEVKTDPGFGISITIENSDGLKTIYSNLASDDMVTVNQKIKQGDIIGCVGNTAAYESMEKSHLHFEVLKGNENLDPKKYLPQKS